MEPAKLSGISAMAITANDHIRKISELLKREVSRNDDCPRCDGEGVVHEVSHPCPECNETGKRANANVP
jgi:DnaJ-class molecular chaperone